MQLQTQKTRLMATLAGLTAESNIENGDPETIKKAKEDLKATIEGLLALNAKEREMIAKLAPEK